MLMNEYLYVFSLVLRRWRRQLQNRMNPSSRYSIYLLLFSIQGLAVVSIMCLILQHSSVAQQEQQEKAWLRHKHALAKVKLERVSGLPCMQRFASELKLLMHSLLTTTPVSTVV
jgi:hypothetical protein